MNMKEQKKKLNTIFKQMELPRQLKSWEIDFNKFNNKKITLNKFKSGFDSLDSQVDIYGSTKAPDLIKKKLIKYYQAQTKLDAYLLAQAKNIFIVYIKLSNNCKIEWQNNLDSLQVVVFIVSGSGSLDIIEKQKLINKYSGQAIFIESSGKTKVSYTLLKNQQLGFCHLLYKAQAGRNLFFTWQIGLSIRGKLSGSFICAGRENSDIRHIVSSRMKNNAKMSLFVANEHNYSSSRGDIAFKGLAEDKSNSLVEGMIKIGKKGARVDSYLQQDILLLSDRAMVSAIPNLEILNKEVKASHGATIGKLDPQALFYLQSRGLNKSQAEKLLVSGFFNDIFGKIKDKEIRSEFERLLIKNI